MVRVGDSLDQKFLNKFEVRAIKLSYSKNDFKNLLAKSSVEPENHLNELSSVFNNRDIKNRLKNLLPPLKLGSFGAYWDGAMVVINTIEWEKDLRIKKADLDLLNEDLNILATFF